MLKGVAPLKASDCLPILENGERMTQPEFHRRYQEYPGSLKFELIGGIVYMASPTRWPHGQYHSDLNFLLKLYAAGTPGIDLGDNATMILGEESEPQPDLALRILDEYGGQSRLNEEEYLEGAPELIAEVAYSSRSIDLNQKRIDYESAGVQEYLVLSLEDRRLFWFDVAAASEILPNRQGVLRSVVFPGLWLHEQSLLDRDLARAQEIVQQGLASREHRSFVRRLERQRRNRGG